MANLFAALFEEIWWDFYQCKVFSCEVMMFSWLENIQAMLAKLGNNHSD